MRTRILGHEKQRAALLERARGGSLAGSYMFFGESQIGKLLVAKEIAATLEAHPSAPTETLVVSPDFETLTIGIAEVRRVKEFFSLKAVSGATRTVIVDGADSMTVHAEHALLKISEEPPRGALLILVLQNPASLMETLQSRFQKVYFGRISRHDIEEWLVQEHGVARGKAGAVARASFGKPGFALELVEAEKGGGGGEMPDALETDAACERFVALSIAKLYGEDKIGNASAMQRLLVFLARMKRFNVNKKIQLRAALWNNS
ncbi:MAG: hypothetical protein HY536_00295 [Candidatus Colwellbacteria bacterium]|nr:hypothetical protein [Candidatus Colwellbacteria bacterium]